MATKFVPQVARRAAELDEDGFVYFFPRSHSQQEVSRLQRDDRDRHIGQRIADEGGQKRRKDRAAHDLGEDRGDQEMQPEERREDGHCTREDPARDLFRRSGQAAQPMLHVLERTRPATARPQGLRDDL